MILLDMRRKKKKSVPDIIMGIASKESLDVILLSSEVGVAEELIEICPSLHDLHLIREPSKHLKSTQPFRNRSSRDLSYNQ